MFNFLRPSPLPRLNPESLAYTLKLEGEISALKESNFLWKERCKSLERALQAVVDDKEQYVKTTTCLRDDALRTQALTQTLASREPGESLEDTMIRLAAFYEFLTTGAA